MPNSVISRFLAGIAVFGGLNMTAQAERLSSEKFDTLHTEMEKIKKIRSKMGINYMSLYIDYGINQDGDIKVINNRLNIDSLQLAELTNIIYFNKNRTEDYTLVKRSGNIPEVAYKDKERLQKAQKQAYDVIVFSEIVKDLRSKKSDDYMPIGYENALRRLATAYKGLGIKRQNGEFVAAYADYIPLPQTLLKKYHTAEGKEKRILKRQLLQMNIPLESSENISQNNLENKKQNSSAPYTWSE